MRRIGTLSDPSQAKRFADYLVTQSIECLVETQHAERSGADQPLGNNARTEGEAATECDIWIREESDVERAREEFAQFMQSPEDAKYDVQGAAEKIRNERVSEEKRKLKLQQRVRPKSSSMPGPMMGVPVRQQSIPVVIAVIAVCVVAGFATGMGNPWPSRIPGELSTEETVFSTMSFVDRFEYAQTDDPFASIRKGQVWRLVTHLCLHGSTFHLAFNMLAIFFLGSVLERLQGSWFLGLLLLFCGVFGSLFNVMLPPEEDLPTILHGLAGSPLLIGASGAVYGLFGYLWIRPLLTPTFPVRMVPMNVAIMLGWLVFCVFFVDRIANGAHIGGLIAGVVIAAVLSKIQPD